MPKVMKVARKGGNLPRRRSQEAPGEPSQLELVPQSQETEEEAPEAILEPGDPAAGIVITVSSCKLKESKKRRKGNSVYRGCMGKGQDGRMYWWGLELEDEELEKGAQVVIRGSLGSPFGDEGQIYPFREIVSILPYEEVAAVASSAKVSQPMDDELVQIVTDLAQRYGFPTLLRALAEIAN
jgi:hypothetical protein